MSAASRWAFADLWREIRSGRLGVVGAEVGSDGYLVRLAKRLTPLVLEQGPLEMFEAAIANGYRDTAFEHSVSPAAVAAQAKLVAEELGLRDPPSRLPSPLVLAAQAYRSGHGITAEQQTTQQEVVVRVPRMDATLRELLPPAELAVVALVLDGFSWQRIASLRQSAARGVANNISKAFKRIGVTGRSSLIWWLAVEAKALEPRLVTSTPA